MSYQFSIITVTLNSERYLQKTIEHVNKQNLSDNVEYLIIDGVSTDSTLDIIQENIQKGRVTHFISEPDEGIFDAMNKGVKNSQGKYIGIINSDDYYNKNILNDVLQAFQSDPNIGVVYGNVGFIDANDKLIKIYNSQHDDFIKRFRMTVPHPGVFVRKDIYDKYGLFDKNQNIGADFDFMLRLLNNGVHFKKINKLVAYFRTGGNSNITSIKSLKVRSNEVLASCNNYNISRWYAYKSILKYWGSFALQKLYR